MEYYHVYLEYRIENKDGNNIWYDLSANSVINKVVKPFSANKKFLFAGFPLSRENIVRLLFFKSEKPFNSFVFPNGNTSRELTNSQIVTCICNQQVPGVFLTDQFDFELDEPNNILTNQVDRFKKKNKIFIVHGRDKTPALELKDYLKDTLMLDAVIFDDIKLKRTSSTIIEILEDISDNAGYAFIVATPDDLGCLCKTVDEYKKSLIGKRITHKELTDVLAMFNHRARQNVVFEHGLFTGALGRDKVCCLLHTDLTKDKPTDIDGILYEPFKDSIKETFPQITEKLKDLKIGLIK